MSIRLAYCFLAAHATKASGCRVLNSKLGESSSRIVTRGYLINAGRAQMRLNVPSPSESLTSMLGYRPTTASRIRSCNCASCRTASVAMATSLTDRINGERLQPPRPNSCSRALTWRVHEKRLAAGIGLPSCTGRAHGSVRGTAFIIHSQQSLFVQVPLSGRKRF
jgi:hypothetical protein